MLPPPIQSYGRSRSRARTHNPPYSRRKTTMFERLLLIFLLCISFFLFAFTISLLFKPDNISSQAVNNGILTVTSTTDASSSDTEHIETTKSTSTSTVTMYVEVSDSTTTSPTEYDFWEHFNCTSVTISTQQTTTTRKTTTQPVTTTTTTTTTTTPTYTTSKRTTTVTTTTTTITEPSRLEIPNDAYGELVEQILYYVNIERSKSGLNKVSLGDNTMQAAAEIRAVEISNDFSHTRPDGRNYYTVCQDLELDYLNFGENLLRSNDPDITAKYMVELWMDSKSHREIIMNPIYEYMDIGVFYKDGYIYVAQHFYKLQ